MATQLSIQSIADLVHTATTNFTGNIPSGALTTTLAGFTWASDIDQGLVNPAQLGINDPLRVLRIQLFMAGQDTWKVELLDGASAMTLASGTTESKYFGEDLGVYLTAGQKLKVTTTGAGTSSVKMICTVRLAYLDR